MRKKEDTICGHVPTVAGITACLFMTVSWTACFVWNPIAGDLQKAFQTTTISVNGTPRIFSA